MVTYMEGDVNKEWHTVVWIKKHMPRLFDKILVLILNIKCEMQRKKYWSGDFSKVPLFKQIEIETVNICNNDCSFCPVSVNNDIRAHTRMDAELFEKIVGELATMNYSGIVNLFSNNEPLIDDRIVGFAKKVRLSVPDSKINLYTNGKLLTKEIFEELIRYVTYLQIDNYSDDMKIQDHIEFVLKACESDLSIDRKVNICVMKKNQIRSSRGGNAPNKRGVRPIKCRCILPLHEMTVRADGHVSMCCNDAYGEVTLGDVRTQSLLDIWRSEKYRNFRVKIFNGRENIKVCKRCDSVDFGRDKFWSKI